MVAKLLVFTAANKTAVLESHQKNLNDLKKNVKLIRKWFKTQRHLPEIPDDGRIENVLIWCKFRIDKVKTVFDSYYTYRTKTPDFFNATPNSPQIQKAINTVYFVALPKLTPDLYRVIFIKFKDCDAENFVLLDQLRKLILLLEIMLQKDCSLGAIFIVDAGGVTLRHIKKLYYSNLKNILVIFQKAYCGRVRKVVFLNGSIIIQGLIAVINFVMPKVGQRVSVDTGTDSLLKLFPREIIPVDYGGGEKSMEELNEDWRKLLSDWNPWFESRQDLKVDQNLRTKR